jgi:16S rRNA processing protein RimM
MTQDSFSSGRENSAGSSGQGEPAFLAVGRLRRPHGLRGEMQMDVLTDFPERFIPGAELFIGPSHHPVVIKAIRQHDKLMLVLLEGYDSPEKAGELRNLIVFVSTRDRPALEEGEYYHHELLGLSAIDEDGHHLGSVKEILETGANDVLVVQPESGPEILLPVTDEVILKVDLVEGLIRVHLLPGLLYE